MSNERIDLTKDGLRKAIREHEGKYFEPTIEDVEIILTCLEGIGLLAELKRMYRLEDDYRNLLNQYWLDEGWTATCKADGEGECRLEIETLDELMELVANETVEIPEYSHSSDELILYEEHCTCGVSHEEWMISTGRASE